jgi:hypothetical protein
VPPDQIFVLTDRGLIGHPAYWQHILELPYHLSANTLLNVMPHVLVNETPGSSRTRASPVRNAFGGQVIGSTARLRRLKFGMESPLKIIK